MSRKKTFDNGSYVEWVDRETLKYTSGDFSVLVWVDFEPGLFSGGRIIKASSIKNWDAKPAERGNFQIFWGFKKRVKNPSGIKLVASITIFISRCSVQLAASLLAGSSQNFSMMSISFRYSLMPAICVSSSRFLSKMS
jgi:hypothetical protein